MIIGIVGRLRSGKDAVAQSIIGHRNTFERVGFADQLKDLALSIDPVIPATISSPPRAVTNDEIRDGAAATLARLSQVVRWSGWERAKDLYPEVRRFLQHLGTGVRDTVGSDAWVDAWQAQLPSVRLENLNGELYIHTLPADIVVPDTRFPNEAARIKSLGGYVIRVVRPSLVSTSTHPSETEQDEIVVDYTIVNDGTLDDLSEQVADILDKMGI